MIPKLKLALICFKYFSIRKMLKLLLILIPKKKILYFDVTVNVINVSLKKCSFFFFFFLNIKMIEILLMKTKEIHGC
jgi:hypothetical protein